MNNIKYISFILLFSLLFQLILPIPLFIPSAEAATTIIVTAQSTHTPSYRWCQRLDGSWTTNSDLDGPVNAINDQDEPSSQTPYSLGSDRIQLLSLPEKSHVYVIGSPVVFPSPTALSRLKLSLPDDDALYYPAVIAVSDLTSNSLVIIRTRLPLDMTLNLRQENFITYPKSGGQRYSSDELKDKFVAIEASVLKT